MSNFQLSIFSFQLLVFVVGTVVGSFLNVVIDRLPAGESILRGRSRCDFCDHQLRWYELIPLLSFFIQRGRCRECGEQLSFQYPAIELLTGLLTVAVFSSVHSGQFTVHSLTQVAYLLLITYVLVAITTIDFKEGIIPDKLTLVLIFTALAFRITNYGLRITDYAVSAAGASIFLWLLATGASKVLGKPAMGFGDVKFAFAMGLILGWPNTVIAMYLAFVLGAVVALGLMAIGKKRFGQTIPFGPFLAAATWVVMVYGNLVLNWT